MPDPSISSVDQTPLSAPQPTLIDSKALAMTVVAAADERQGGDLAWLAMEDVSLLADYFVIVTGYSTTQVRAIARAIEDNVMAEWNRVPRQTAGQQAATWILLDYGDVIVHVMLEAERAFYDLEAFWGHAPRLSIPTDDTQQ